MKYVFAIVVDRYMIVPGQDKLQQILDLLQGAQFMELDYGDDLKGGARPPRIHMVEEEKIAGAFAKARMLKNSN